MFINALLVIDGYSLLRRVYEADKESSPAQRAHRAASRCFHNFKRQLELFPSTHALVVFDAPGPTWRHRLYPQYKSTRSPTPTPVREAAETLTAWCRDELDLACVKHHQHEADDVIAAAVRSYLRLPESVVRIVSVDKDLAALICPAVELYDPSKREVRCESYPIERFGVRAGQMHDFLALTGDASDDIPGVPSIGPATAAKLLQKYGSLAAILSSDEEDCAVAREHADLAMLSRSLTELRCDPPLSIDWHDCLRPDFSNAVLPAHRSSITESPNL